MGKLLSAVNNRLGGSELAYPVPEHANSVKYMLGGVTLFCILTAVFSGIILAQFYNPDPNYAHASIVYTSSKVFLGDFVRNVHFWSANLALILIIFHAVRVFVTGSYKKPREATWLTGILLLVVMFAIVFSGTILKWDQEAVEALAHSDAAASFLGPIGVLFSSGAGVSVPFLPRLYAAHVGTLILLLFLTLFIHLFLVKKHGISPKAVYGAVVHSTHGKGSSNFLAHLKIMIGYGLLSVSLIATLALLFSAPLGQPGVPGAELTKPPWIFLPLYALENIFGMAALFWAPAVILILLIALPFIDRNDKVSPRQRKAAVTIGALFIAVLLALGYYAWKTPVKSHMMGGQNINKSAISKISNLFFPVVSAGGSHAQRVNASPANIMLGDKVTIEAEGIKPDTYRVSLHGFRGSFDLGEVTVGEEEGFVQEYAVPIEEPDVLRIQLTDSSGKKFYSENPLVVQVKQYPNAAEASAKEYPLNSQNSHAELLVIFSLILMFSFAGAILVL
jgi:ubiquinol-cytochrome c reductase cytochrome b subunit